MNKRKSFQNGITLIALVISIIVMLILAGVSLNATIGDNGIITKAQQATFATSANCIEEYLQQLYLKEKMNSDDQLENPIDYVLKSQDSPIYISILGYSYVWDDEGTLRYFLDKSKLPDDVKKQVQSSENKEYEDYVELSDVYGITSDLKVYYYNKNSNCFYGIDNENIKLNLDKEQFSSGTTMSKIFEQDSVTMKNLMQRDEIILDGNAYSEDEIDYVFQKSAYFRNLKKLTLKNVNLSSVDGINYFTKLSYFALENVNCKNYDGIEKLIKLQYLYIDKIDQENLNKIFSSMNNTDYNDLQYLYIRFANGTSSYPKNINDISCINSLTTATKSKISYMYLNYLNISSVDFSDFYSLTRIETSYNNYLTEIKGFSKLNKLQLLMLENDNALEKIEEGFSKDSTLERYYGRSDKKLKSFEFLKECTKLNYVYSNDNYALDDISGLANKSNLYYVDLNKCTKLEILDSLKNDVAIRYLYLKDCDATNAKQISEIRSIIENCISYTLPIGYSLIFADSSVEIILDGETLKLDELDSLKGNLNCKYLSIVDVKWKDSAGNVMNKTTTENKTLINSKLNEIIGSLRNLEALRCKNESALLTIDFMQFLLNLYELDLRGTSVTDLTILNNDCTEKAMTSILIDNEGIDLTKIQPFINALCSRQRKSHYYNAMISNLCLASKTNNNLANQLSLCTDLENLKVSAEWYDGARGVVGTIDLSNLTKLENMEMSSAKWGVKYPSSLKTLRYPGNTEQLEIYDFSLIHNLDYLTADGIEYTKFFNKLPKECTAKKIHVRYPKDAKLDFSNLDMSKTEDLSMVEYGEKGPVNEIVGLINLASLVNLSFNNKNTTKCNTIDYAPNLKTVNVNYNKIESLDFLKNCTNITKIEARSNRIFDLKCIKNFEKLEYLDLRDNVLQNISTYVNENGDIITYKNLDILVDLKKKNDKFQTLYLSGNNFIDYDYESSGIRKLSWKSWGIDW